MSEQEPILYVFFGLIASGKSSLALAWARKRGLAYYNSDVVRKQLVGLAPASHRAESYQAGLYSREFSRRTYDALLAAAADALRARRSVVLDASFARKEERERVRQLAISFGVPVRFILCHCSEEETRRRLAMRARDATAVSDGNWDIYLRQKTAFEAADELAANELLWIETDAEPRRLVKRLEVLSNIG